MLYFSVLKPLACGRQSQCLGWTYKLPGRQKFSIKLSPLSVRFPQRRPLNLIKRPQIIRSRRSTVGKCTGPKWSKTTILVENDLILNRILVFARPKWTKMVHFGPFWPEEVHFGPFRSANRTLATPEIINSPGVRFINHPACS